MRIAIGLAVITVWLAVEASDATLEAHGAAGGGGSSVVVVRPAPSVRSAPGVTAKVPSSTKGPAVNGPAVKGAARKAPTPTSTWWYFSDNNTSDDLKCTKAKQKKGCRN
jgi:hypothetical protein